MSILRPGLSGDPDTVTPKFQIVSTAKDFPKPASGVITLEDDVTYFIAGEIDLSGSRIISGANTTLIGGSSENCRIKSTGLTGIALITSEWSLPMRNLTIEADVALDLDASGNSGQALDWFGVNFTDCSTVGTIANYNNVIWSDCAILNSEGLTFDGTIGTVGFSQCIFSSSGSGTIVTVSSTATVTRRFRIIYSAVVVSDESGTGINVRKSATVPVEGYILDTVNFSGLGTYTTGVEYSDNKALFVNNRGIKNSAAIGGYYMVGNATATTIASTGVPYKVAGTTTASSLTQKFTHSNNRLTYTGALTRDFRVSAVASANSTAANHQIGLYIAKNGTVLPESEIYVTSNAASRAEAAKVQSFVNLTTNDYIEIFVENNTSAANITVTELNVIVESAN